jgi:hypothetical protein
MAVSSRDVNADLVKGCNPLGCLHENNGAKVGGLFVMRCFCNADKGFDRPSCLVQYTSLPVLNTLVLGNLNTNTFNPFLSDSSLMFPRVM